MWASERMRPLKSATGSVVGIFLNTAFRKWLEEVDQRGWQQDNRDETFFRKVIEPREEKC